MYRFVTGVLWLAVGWGVYGQVFGQEEPATTPAVSRLIAQLGDDDPDQRDRAQNALAELGSSVREELEAASVSPDPEVRLRAARLLRELKCAELWQPSFFTTNVTRQPASAVLAELSRQTGNPIETLTGAWSFRDTVVDLTCVQLPFWQVIDAICAETGSIVYGKLDNQVKYLVAQRGETGHFPVSYAGPFKLRLVDCRRSFFEELDYSTLTTTMTHNFNFDLHLQWESRCHVVACQTRPKLVEAVTEAGTVLIASNFDHTHTVVDMDTDTSERKIGLAIAAPPTSVTTLQQLHLQWDIIAVGDKRVLEVTNLASSEPNVQENIELVVHSVKRVVTGNYELKMTVKRDLATPYPREIWMAENLYELFDSQGRPFRLSHQIRGLEEAELLLYFVAEDHHDVPASLRCTYPGVRDQRTLDFVFTDVPLPTARP